MLCRALLVGCLLSLAAVSAKAQCTQTGGYPWVPGSCINPTDLNRALEGSVGNTPPTNSYNQGVGFGKLWLDTSATPSHIRQCIVHPPGQCSPAYNSSQWIDWGVIDGSLLDLPIGGGTATVASSTTVDLGLYPQASITISGNASISSFGSTLPAGRAKFLSFTGSPTIVYGPSSIVTPGSANLTPAPGDVMIAISDGGGKFSVLFHGGASGSFSNPAISGGTISNAAISGGTATGVGISGGTATGVGLSGGTISNAAISGGTATGVGINGGSVGSTTPITLASTCGSSGTLFNNNGVAQACPGGGVYSPITSGYRQFLRDFWGRYFDSSTIIPRIRPVNSGAAYGGYIDNTLTTFFGTYWMMAEAANILYWEWKTTRNPEAQARLQSQWNTVKSMYTPTQLSSADPSVNGFTINALDDSALALQLLTQVHEVTGDTQALNDAVALLASIRTFFADSSGCGLRYTPSTKQSEIIESMIARSALYLYQKTSNAAYLTYAQSVWTWINSGCAQHPYGIYYEGADLDSGHACYQQGVGCASPSNIFIGGASAGYFGGTLETLSLGAVLYRLTGTSSYLTTVNSVLTAMLQSRTYLRPGSNVGLSGSVFLNDRDPWSDGIGAQAFVFDVLTLGGVDATNAFRPVFMNTAQSIINSRTTGTPAGFQDGYYTADWSGPEATGQQSDGTPSATNCPCTWALRGVTQFSSTPASQFNPVITANASISGSTLTVTTTSSPGTITVGQYLNGSGITPETLYITARGTGTGGTGTYILSQTASISSESMNIGGNTYDLCCNFEAEANSLMTVANSGAMIQAAAMLAELYGQTPVARY